MDVKEGLALIDIYDLSSHTHRSGLAAVNCICYITQNSWRRDVTWSAGWKNELHGEWALNHDVGIPLWASAERRGDKNTMMNFTSSSISCSNRSTSSHLARQLWKLAFGFGLLGSSGAKTNLRRIDSLLGEWRWIMPGRGYWFHGLYTASSQPTESVTNHRERVGARAETVVLDHQVFSWRIVWHVVRMQSNMQNVNNPNPCIKTRPSAVCLTGE